MIYYIFLSKPQPTRISYLQKLIEKLSKPQLNHKTTPRQPQNNTTQLKLGLTRLLVCTTITTTTTPPTIRNSNCSLTAIQANFRVTQGKVGQLRTSQDNIRQLRAIQCNLTQKKQNKTKKIGVDTIEIILVYIVFST